MFETDHQNNRKADTMNKKELALLVANRTGLSKREALKAVQATIDCMIDTLQTGERITIMGFGAFFSCERPPRVTYNLYTKEREHLNSRKVIKFRPTFPSK